jgi:hypothetical protein
MGKTPHPTPHTPHPAPTKNFFSSPYLEITLLDRGEQGRRALLNFVGGDEKNSDPTGIAIST